jgi:hypothetical protein
MKKLERVVVEEIKFLPSSICCNKCGKSQELHGDEYQREWESVLFQTIVCSFGYGSKFDTDDWKFDLCEKCLVDIIRTFKHLPEGYDEEYVNGVYDKL